MNIVSRIMFNLQIKKWAYQPLVAILFCFVVCISSVSTLLYAKNPTPLPLEQAFVLDAQYQAPILLLRWQIAPHYYLYRDKIKITASQAVTLKIDYPSGDL